MAIQILSDFFGNAHVDTNRMLSIARESGTYVVPLWELLAAIIYGDTEYYDPERSPVANLFDVHRNDPKEHFLLPVLLAFLRQPGPFGADNGFVESGPIYERVQSLGFTPDQIDHALLKSMKSGLVETVGRRIGDGDVARSTAFRVTSRGDYQVSRLCGMFTYLDAVIVDTPIFDETARQALRSGGLAVAMVDRVRRVDLFSKYLTGIWETAGLQGSDFSWQDRSRELEEELAKIRSRLAQRTMKY
ncbi:MAG: hypothetical protein O3A53_10310 [Acidobacteria bacterium]|nr:hypothetical protein [Acidobacteriota bacterium]MDA1235182.1 hypothetical protein [Acidobacteriota bacterium]